MIELNLRMFRLVIEQICKWHRNGKCHYDSYPEDCKCDEDCPFVEHYLKKGWRDKINEIKELSDKITNISLEKLKIYMMSIYWDFIEYHPIKTDEIRAINRHLDEYFEIPFPKNDNKSIEKIEIITCLSNIHSKSITQILNELIKNEGK